MVSPILPDLSHEWQVPQTTLDRRLHQLHNKMVPQVLVQWSQWHVELSTWEDEEALRQQFPKAPAWDQAGFEERGDVTTHVYKASTEHGRREVKRCNRRKNLRVTGADWVV